MSWTMRAQRRRQAREDAAFERQQARDVAGQRSRPCPYCPDGAVPIPAGRHGEHVETFHAWALPDAVC